MSAPIKTIQDIRHREIRGLTYGLMVTLIACTITIVYKGGYWYTKGVQYVERNDAVNNDQTKDINALKQSYTDLKALQLNQQSDIEKNKSDIYDLVAGRRTVFTQPTK